MNTERTTLPLYDLGCGGGGVLAIERALARLPGVIRVYANPVTEMAYVQYDAAQVTIGQLVAAIEHVGFHSGVPIAR